MSGVYKFRLANTLHYESRIKPHYNGDTHIALPDASMPWLWISNTGEITIKKDYCWDGCSPKLKFFDLFLIGIPDGIININTGKPKTYYASCVHDALYQFMDHPAFPYSRLQADQIFYQLLVEADFKPARVYYYAVRAFGRIRERSRDQIKLLRRGWS